MTSTSDIFTNTQVTRICRPSFVAALHTHLLHTPNATINEVVAISDAAAFALHWANQNESDFFRVEDVAKHCNNIITIAARHGFAR